MHSRYFTFIMSAYHMKVYKPETEMVPPPILMCVLYIVASISMPFQLITIKIKLIQFDNNKK